MSRNETIDFSEAQAGIERLLEAVSIPDITDLHVQDGKATVRVNGACGEVDLGGIQLDHAVAEIAATTASALGREISWRTPILEQRIPPRYRVTCSHPSIDGGGRWSMSLRLLSLDTIPLWKWVEDGFLSDQDHGRLVRLMAEPTTVLIAGTMGSGKTTLLRSMIAEIPADQRLVVTEDAAELNLNRANTLSIISSPAADLSALITHAFRHDAERVVVGEVRDASAMQFLTLASGGTRALTTIHAEPNVGGLTRLHWLVQQSGFHVTMDQIKDAIHAVVTVRRLPDGRRLVEVWEAQR